MSCPSCGKPSSDGICATCIMAETTMREIRRVSGDVLASYFENGQMVGKRSTYASSYEEDGQHYSTYWPNIAYVCPFCGELWGRLRYDFAFTYSPVPRNGWVVEVRRCRSCGDGQFLVGQPVDYADADLLRRELSILLEKNYD